MFSLFLRKIQQLEYIERRAAPFFLLLVQLHNLGHLGQYARYLFLHYSLLFAFVGTTKKASGAFVGRQTFFDDDAKIALLLRI